MEKTQPTVVAIIPIGIPGIGKTRVFEALMKHGEALKTFAFDSISSDDTRKVCIDKYMVEHPSASPDDAFKGTQGAYKKAFNSALEHVAEKYVPGKVHCIIVDKNHPGNGISSSVEVLAKQVGKKGKFMALGLISKEAKGIQHQGASFPFSYSTVLYCIKRLLQRKVHSTLTCEDEVKAVHVLVFFLRLYQNFVPKPYYLQKQGIAGIIEIPFTPTLESIPEDLMAAFLAVLDNTTIKAHDCTRPDLVKELIAKMRKHESLFEKEADINANAESLFTQMCSYCGKHSAPEEAVPATSAVPPPAKTEPKVPVFLGVKVTSPIKNVLDLAYKACKEVKKSATIDDGGELNDLRKYLEEETGTWKFPNSHHVTALFIGGNKSLTETKLFQDFPDEKEMEIKLGAVVVVPHKLVFGICFLKTQIGNKVPHLTILVNHCPPKVSNTFGEALFLNVPELKEKYAGGFFEKDGEEFVQRYDVSAEGGKHRVYVYKPANVLSLNGVCKKFYQQIL